MTLANYTSAALMIPECRSKTSATLVAELCVALQHQGRLSDSGAFYDAVMARELLSGTFMPPGWALPHARLPGLPRLSFALARSSQPLLWFGERVARVRMVFLFAVPEHEAGNYLTVISAVAKLSQNLVLLERLQSSNDGEAMLDILTQVPLRLTRPTAPATVIPRSVSTP